MSMSNTEKKVEEIRADLKAAKPGMDSAKSAQKKFSASEKTVEV